MRTSLICLAIMLAISMVMGCAPATNEVHQCATVDGVQVCSPFMEHYEAWGGQDVLGRPLSCVVMEKGQRVQYFESVCMQADAFTGEVTLANLGDQMGLRTAPLDPATAAMRIESGSIYFPETGHSLCPAFDGIYQDLGGASVLGYPIAEFTVEGAMIVQSFERAKLEWNPQDGLGAVRLAKLGEKQWRLRQSAQGQPGGTARSLGENTTMSGVVEPSNPTRVEAYVPAPTGVPLPIRIDLSLAADVLACPGQQTVVLRVLDATGAGLPGFACTAIIHERNSDRVLHFDVTDDQGFASQSYDLDPGSQGFKVVVSAQVVYAGQVYDSVSSYVVW